MRAALTALQFRNAAHAAFQNGFVHWFGTGIGEPVRRPSVPAQPRRVENPRLTALHNKPFPLQGIKILDFAWFLASAGGTRFLAAMGAESFKVEWKDNPDTRLAAMAPVGGRAAREAATGPLPGVPIPIWAASSTTRMPASAASR